MIRNCIAAIVLWIVLVAGYGIFLWKRSPPDAQLVLPLMMASAVWIGLVTMHGARYSYRDWSARNRLARGERPSDGDLVAAVGEIRPTFEVLRAPFSDRACVLYTYDIGPRARGDGNAARDFVGFAMARCSVHTPYGSFQLGSFPVLDRFPKERGDGARAEAYVASTEFEEMTGVVQIAKSTFGLHTSPPPLRKDWQIGPRPETLQGAEITERIVESGTRVTAIGRYVSSQNAIVSDLQEKGYLRVWPGGDASGVSSFPTKAVMQLAAGVIIIAASNAALWWWLFRSAAA